MRINFILPDCCKPDTVLKRGSRVCHCVYPIKIDLLLLNVSQNPNWTVFLDQLANQLGLRVPQIELINFYVLSLSRLNISMDITPHTGISFSANEASAINSSLANHRVHLDPTLVGDYELLNLTWFQPPPPSPGISVLPLEVLESGYAEMSYFVVLYAYCFLSQTLSLSLSIYLFFSCRFCIFMQELI